MESFIFSSRRQNLAGGGNAAVVGGDAGEGIPETGQAERLRDVAWFCHASQNSAASDAFTEWLLAKGTRRSALGGAKRAISAAMMLTRVKPEIVELLR